MSKPATTAQISYIRTLATQAGYDGDRGYAAANDLLGDGRRWNQTAERASQIIDALKAKIGIVSTTSATTTYTRCRDCGAPGHTDHRGLGISCGCAAE